MKTLFPRINVSTNENDAVGAYSSISVEDWANCETTETITTGFQSIGLNPDDYDNNDWWNSVEVVENMLNHAFNGETVYFWVDAE